MTVLDHPLALPLLGGAILGVASAAKYILCGRILGISGTYGGLIRRESPIDWRACFVSGLLIGGAYIKSSAPGLLPSIPTTYPIWRIIVAGLLVGVGSTIGNGCTSGHGIMGLSRASKRSFVYVMTFMISGFFTATLLSSAKEASEIRTATASLELALNTLGISGLLLALLTGFGFFKNYKTDKSGLKMIVEVISGFVFAIGLAVSGMVSPYKVASFLDISNLSTWDPSLMMVMGGAIGVVFPLVQLAKARLQSKMRPPLLGGKFPVLSTHIDKKLILGGVMFGSGWGLAGMCPGPALVSLVNLSPLGFYFIGAMSAGMIAAPYLDQKVESKK